LSIEFTPAANGAFKEGSMGKRLLMDMTSDEAKEVALSGAVVILPVGCIEQHGPHLPVDTDSRLVEAVTLMAAEKAEQLGARVVVLPVLHYSYAMNQIYFPGTIAIEAETLIHVVFDICRSLVRQGFRKILIVNGHAPNIGSLDVAANRATNELGALVGACNYWSFGRETVEAVRESEFPGGMAHACEFETSLYLALAPDRVKMDRAIRENRQTPSQYYWRDIRGPGPVLLWDPFYLVSTTGVLGDPTVASGEKGRRIMEAIAEDMGRFLMEFYLRPWPPSLDNTSPAFDSI
jgi:creatinine amidohydrolase